MMTLPDPTPGPEIVQLFLPQTLKPLLLAAAVSKVKRTPQTQLERIGWASDAQRVAFDAVRRRKKP
jgi:hypothetical protein